MRYFNEQILADKNFLTGIFDFSSQITGFFEDQTESYAIIFLVDTTLNIKLELNFAFFESIQCPSYLLSDGTMFLWNCLR